MEQARHNLEADNVVNIGEGLRMFKDDGTRVTYNPELENRWGNNEVSSDLYFTIGAIEMAVRNARDEAQDAAHVAALNTQLDELYTIAGSPEAVTWSKR